MYDLHSKREQFLEFLPWIRTQRRLTQLRESVCVTRPYLNFDGGDYVCQCAACAWVGGGADHKIVNIERSMTN